jgi:nucleoside-diphosphate-sugar epimerase
MRVAITGATGFVGADLLDAILERGWDVVALVRHVPKAPRAGVSYHEHDLSAPVEPAILKGVDEVVHCAYVKAGRGTPDSHGQNVRGTLALESAAASRGIGFTFLSSLSAVPQARSAYGRHKLELERLMLERGATVVRPGLVVGDGGVVRAIYDTMRRTHLIPLIDGGRQPVQTIGRRDLSLTIGTLIERKQRPTSITVATAQPMTARRLALDLRRRFALTAFAVAIPSWTILPIVRGAESLGRPTPITSENILGLQSAEVQPVTDVRALLNIHLKPWGELLAGLHFCP